MRGITGVLRFESHEELEEYFEFAEGFLMTKEDVESGLQGVPEEEIPYPIELDFNLDGRTVKKLAEKNPEKTAKLNKMVEQEWEE